MSRTQKRSRLRGLFWAGYLLALVGFSAFVLAGWTAALVAGITGVGLVFGAIIAAFDERSES